MLSRLWSNPAYRFVSLFLLYLAIEAVAYPFLKQRFTFVVKWMIIGTAKVAVTSRTAMVETIGNTINSLSARNTAALALSSAQLFFIF